MQVVIYIYNVTSKKIFNCGILLAKMLQIDPIFSTIHMFGFLWDILKLKIILKPTINL